MMQTPCILAAVWLALAGLACAEQEAAPGKPNIIVILADDLGWRDLGCYGSEVFQTPNLDRMAQGGMQFTSAYAACCVCSPTRASLMTGKYPARLGLTIWLGGKGGAPSADHLSLDETTLAESLRAGGYVTALVGKWHLGDRPCWPKLQGFDIAIGEPHSGSPAGGYYLPNRMSLPGAKQGDYLTDRLTDEAVKIIEDNRERPFFLYQAYHSVHTPIQGRPDLVQKHQQRAAREGKSFNTQYAAMLESLDAGVGRIMDTLRKHDLLERTAVFSTSDNGGNAYSGGKKNDVTDNTPLKFGKGYCYEGGHRVPWLVHYPPRVRPGSRTDEPVITTDLYPTILRLAGLPALPEQHCDGRDLSSLLAETSMKVDRDSLYWHYPHPSPQGGTPSGAIRSGEWKLIEFFDDGRQELYRLSQDLGEQNNLARELPDKAKELHGKLIAWRKAVGAKLPSAGELQFQHHYIDRYLPCSSYGQTSLVDIDRDGDLDFITGGKAEGNTVFWFEYQTPDKWVRHMLGKEHPSDVGGTAFDVDNDGQPDHVSGGVWYRNMGKPREEPFERVVFDPGLAAVHDLVAADLDRDGRLDIITMSDKNNLRWYRIPKNPRDPWQRRDIGPGVHAGMAIGDLDGDGDPDVVRSNVWFENADGQAMRWVEHPLPFGKPTPPYPLATRCVVVDLDKDGDADLVMTENEIRAGRIAWLENVNGKGQRWQAHDLPASDDTPRGAYHSLAVADFDNDGDQDIFTAEMEAIAGARQPRWYLWENRDGRGQQLVERVIFDGGLGGHEAVVADVDGDGDLDIASKLWRPRRDNANGGRNHADYLENLLIRKR